MENKESVITVSGVSKIMVSPDQLNLQIVSNSSYDTNVEANNALIQDIDLINDILKELKMEDVKAEIEQSSVSKETHNRYDENNNIIGEDARFNSLLKVSMKMDINHPSSEELIKLIGKKLPNAETSVLFQLKDSTQYALKALAGAVRDARKKAEVIVNALEYQLDTIAKITESCSCDDDSRRFSVLFLESSITGFGSPQTNEPKKISASATVNVTWNISKKE